MPAIRVDKVAKEASKIEAVHTAEAMTEHQGQMMTNAEIVATKDTET
jgi:hypothetical protein